VLHQTSHAVQGGVVFLLMAVLGSLSTANHLAPPERRGHVISAFFVA
jgi:hypothetical protein